MSLERFSNIVEIREARGLVRGVDWNQEDVQEFQFEKLTVRPDETPVVEVHIYTPTSEVYLGGGLITDFVINTDKLYIDYASALSTFNLKRGFFKVVVNVYYNIIGTNDFPELVIKEIAGQRREILISPIVTRSGDDTYEDLIELFLEKYIDPFERDFALNFGNNNIIRIINYKKYLDNDKVLAIRLYSQIPEEIPVLSRVQLIELASDSYIDSISLDQLAPPILPSALKGPNFEIETGYTTITETDFKSWNQLLDANTSTSQKIVDRFFSGSIGNGEELGIDYTGYKNFIYYGSAKSRIDNFRYKLQNIEYYDTRLNTLNNVSGSSSGSLSVNKESTLKKKDALIGEFDAFEKWLYNEPTSSLTTHGVSGSFIGTQERFALTPFPKRIIDGQFVIHQTTGSLADNWYLSASIAATTYDEQNPHQLVKSVPEYIRVDSNNSEYETFVNMIGQHFDILWTYANALTKIYTLEENPKLSIDKDILVNIAKSQGWELTNGYQASQLFRYALGTNESGEYAQSGSLFSTSDEKLTGEVWRRIVNNLPYILKSRGTERGIRSLLNIYGIPQTLLSVREYGGPKVGNDWPVLTEDRYSYSIKFNSGSYLEYTPEFISGSIDKWGRSDLAGEILPPVTREFRFRPDVTQSMLVYSQADNAVNPLVHIGVQYTGSYSGSNQYGRVNLSFASASSTNRPMTASTDWVPLYNGDFWNLKFGWETSGTHYNNIANTDTTYNIYVQHASDFIKGKVSHTASLAITPTNANHYKVWCDPNLTVQPQSVYIGGQTGSGDIHDTNEYIINLQGSVGTYSGSMQEYREWLEFVSIAGFDDHTLNPTSYVSSLNATSSYDTLVRHYTLGSDTIGNDLSVNGTIISSSHPNQAIKNFSDPGGLPLSNATAHGFSTPDDTQRGNFLPVEETYFVAGASLGSNNPRSNKIRLEDNELVRRLSPTNTGEVSSFDNAPIDSNKLGLFYSFADQVNKDIFNHTGRVELDDYVGDPDDEYQQTYSDLKYFSKEYWKKFTDGSDVNAYNRIFSQFDFSVFSQIKQTLAERVDDATGLLIEPNILERSKVTVTKPIKVDEPMYDVLIQQIQPTASGDSDLQYEGIIDDGETTVLTPSAEKMDDMTGTAYQVRYTGSMNYCTIETLPVDELNSYTASIIDSNFNDIYNSSNPAVAGNSVIDFDYENQNILMNPVYSDVISPASWTINQGTSFGKKEWEENIPYGNEVYTIISSPGVLADKARYTNQIRLTTENNYPHDVLVTPRLTFTVSQSRALSTTPALSASQNTMEVQGAIYIPEVDNDPNYRIKRFLDLKEMTASGQYQLTDQLATNTIQFNKVKIPAYTNIVSSLQFKSVGANPYPGSSSISQSIEYTTVSASFELMNDSLSDTFVTMEATATYNTNASNGYLFWRNLQAAGTDIYVGRITPGASDYNDGVSNVRAGYLGEIVNSSFNGDTTNLSGSYVVRTVFSEEPGQFYTDDNANVPLTAQSSSIVYTTINTPIDKSVNIYVNRLAITYDIEKVCHRATNELIDNCRKSNIFKTPVYHYSGSTSIASKYARDFDAAVSESKYQFYSSSLTPSCYRDDFFRYSIQHMATLGSQLTAPSVNSPSVNAALGNKPVIEIFEVNPNQIFYNKTPKQPSRNNRLDPGNLSVR